MGLFDFFHKENKEDLKSKPKVRTENNKKDIKYERFIDVSVSFAMLKEGVKDGIPQDLFRQFKTWAIEPGQEETMNLPEGIYPKLVLLPSLPEPHYMMTKKFKLKIGGKGIEFSFGKKGQKRTMKGNVISDDRKSIFFLSDSKYSPIELAKDVAFLEHFRDAMTEEQGMPEFTSHLISKEKEGFIVWSKEGVVQFVYHLKKRIELYKKYPKIDKYIFGNDLPKILNDKSFFNNSTEQKEAKELTKI